MKWLAGGLTVFNVTVVSALLLGSLLGGLGRFGAFYSLLLGTAAGVLAFRAMHRDAATQPLVEQNTDEESAEPTEVRMALHLARRVGFWLLVACFAFFAFRSFCWLVYVDGNQLKVQSPHNLGDLAIHFTYIRNFASGVPLWPENPLHHDSLTRYPAGIDMFNALLVLLTLDIKTGLIWTGLIGSLASFWALWRWGGGFAVAGFLFNGGIAGFQLLQRWEFLDYQADEGIAWKSLPLTMLVTQRALLYALPAGLVLLYQWRAKFFGDKTARARPPLPFWVELTLYASMPLFHVHTFLALSFVAAFLFVIGDSPTRRQLLMLVGAAFVPATFLTWTVSDRFGAGSMLGWKPGWVQNVGEFAAPWWQFWLLNFGIFLPLVLVLLGVLIHRAIQQVANSSGNGNQTRKRANNRTKRGGEWQLHIQRVLQAFRFSAPLAFVTAGVLIFLFACFVRTAPWEWDNIKLIIWAYLLVLPFLWSELIARWDLPVRAALCVALFFSGFVSLFGGLVPHRGYTFAERAELDSVGIALRRLPAAARFAAYPTYNHPLLLQGRRVVLGYPGHLFSQGFDYNEDWQRLTQLMLGAPEWRENARAFGVRYLFWGREEKKHYGHSKRPWETEAQLVAGGSWGAIYDLEVVPDIPVRPR
jgi:hypothetical protein